MTNKKWTEAELQQIKGLGLPIKKTQRELELEQQVNTLTEALDKMDDRKHPMLPRSEMARIAKETLDSLKESPREEQGK